MSTYRAVEVTGSRKFKLVTRELQQPRAGHVRINVESCGVCHSDALAVEGLRADPSQSVVPGHEIVGVIDAVGDGVTGWQVGERVGVGYLGGHCGQCERCSAGRFHRLYRPAPDGDHRGRWIRGGHLRQGQRARPHPGGHEPRRGGAAPVRRITVFKALQQIDSRPGALVAVQGIGGLGHLGLQYAGKLGYRVAAIARGTDKADLARRLGADHYIDSSSEDPGAALQKLGGAAAIIATAANGASMSPLVAASNPAAAWWSSESPWTPSRSAPWTSPSRTARSGGASSARRSRTRTASRSASVTAFAR
ncbi:alcohol dehydrogenase catalytic domain-containing protein [Streptosporangium lutulentum]